MTHAKSPTARRPTAAPAPAPLSPADLALLTLTADPQLGKADRVSGYEAKGVVTFTFDDGPNPATTPTVLDALLAYDIPASFYIVTKKLVGSAAQPARDLVTRIKRDGFELASHTVTHPVLSGKKPARLAAEIDGSIAMLAEVAGQPIGLFRAPYGAADKRVRAWLAKRGLTEVFWSIDTRDWAATQAQTLRKQVGATILKQRGGVVLMHDIHPITAAVVAQIFDDLEAENCRRIATPDAAKPPIIPVSIHYFLRDRKQPRALPEAVAARTTRYTANLPARCAKRTPAPVSPVPTPVPAPAPAPSPAAVDRPSPQVTR